MKRQNWLPGILFVVAICLPAISFAAAIPVYGQSKGEYCAKVASGSADSTASIDCSDDESSAMYQLRKLWPAASKEIQSSCDQATRKAGARYKFLRDCVLKKETKLTPLPAAPQSATKTNVLQSPEFLGLPEAMQKQIKGEVREFVGSCKGKSVYSVFHDCNCLASSYVNELLHNPKYKGKDLQWVEQTAGDTIGLECVNKPAILKYSHEKCIEIYWSSDAQILGPLCNCYAHAFTEAYAKNPSVIAEYKVQLGVRTYEECRSKIGNGPSSR